MTPKTPTPSAISRLLAGAGFERSKIGMRGGRSGFRVTADRRRDGAIKIEWRPMLINQTTAATRDGFLVRYRKAIIEAGWTVFPGEYELTVTSGEDEQR